MKIKTIGELRKFIKHFEDDFSIGLEDPNFGGFYNDKDPHIMITFDKDNRVLVEFPFEEEVD